MSSEDLTSEQAATFLGVRSLHTVRNWLEGGSFPGAYQDGEGVWRFPIAQLEEVRDHMETYNESRQLRTDLILDK